MNEDFTNGMFIGASITILILSMFALISDKGFSNKQLLQLNLAIEKGINSAR